MLLSPETILYNLFPNSLEITNPFSSKGPYSTFHLSGPYFGYKNTATECNKVFEKVKVNEVPILSPCPEELLFPHSR